MNHSPLIVHDYLLQRGGAERVVQALHSVLKDSPIYTFAYNPNTTFTSFGTADVRVFQSTNILSKSKMLLSLSIVANSSQIQLPESELTIYSSSGWSHYIRPSNQSLLYFHSPARWLYAPDSLTSDSRFLKYCGNRGINIMKTVDRTKTMKHQTIIANSKVTQNRIKEAYERIVPIVHPPVYISQNFQSVVSEIKHDFVLHVGRTRSYKNHNFVEAIAEMSPETLFVFVGVPNNPRNLKNCIYLSGISDGELYWLYSNARMLVAVAEEDFGLTPLEAATFGTPTIALAAGGYLETIKDNETGWLIKSKDPRDFAKIIKTNIKINKLDSEVIRLHANKFSPTKFYQNLAEIAKSENR